MIGMNASLSDELPDDFAISGSGVFSNLFAAFGLREYVVCGGISSSSS